MLQVRGLYALQVRKARAKRVNALRVTLNPHEKREPVLIRLHGLFELLHFGELDPFELVRRRRMSAKVRDDLADRIEEHLRARRLNVCRGDHEPVTREERRRVGHALGRITFPGSRPKLLGQPQLHDSTQKSQCRLHLRMQKQVCRRPCDCSHALVVAPLVRNDDGLRAAFGKPRVDLGRPERLRRAAGQCAERCRD